MEAALPLSEPEEAPARTALSLSLTLRLSAAAACTATTRSLRLSHGRWYRRWPLDVTVRRCFRY
jgi:hypothetical protein